MNNVLVIEGLVLRSLMREGPGKRVVAGATRSNPSPKGEGESERFY